MIILIVLLVLVLAATAFAGNYFYDFALRSRRGESAPAAPGITSSGAAFDMQSTEENAQWLQDNATEMTISSHDGLLLHTYWTQNEGHRYAILVHGYTANGATMVYAAKEFMERGFSTLLPDLRGHGQSEGNYIGMGWPDRKDILSWVDTIIAQDAQAEIILFGISMGGATVMMTAGEDLPDNVKLVIEDCGYSSVWAEFRTQLKAMFGLPAFPALQAASVVTRIRAGYWLGEADTLAQLRKSDPDLPILFIHGEKDTFVPFSMLEDVYAAKRGIKEKLAIADAGHGAAASVDPTLYWETIDAFLEKHL